MNKTDMWIYIDIKSFLSKLNLKYKDLSQLKIILSQLFTTELFKKNVFISYERNPPKKETKNMGNNYNCYRHSFTIFLILWTEK